MSARASSSTPTSGTSRGSYPSRQRRFGPAPLASFEDLPTDEAQSSSEDEKTLSSVRMACPQISLVITDHNEVEHQIETVHLPSLDRLHLHSTLTDGAGKPVEQKRKGSWTDIFSMGRSPTPTKPRERKFSLFNFNFFSREVKPCDAQSECELQSLVITQPVTQRNEFTPVNIVHDIGVQMTDEDFEDEQLTVNNNDEHDYDLTPTNVEAPSLNFVETIVQVEHPPDEEDNQTEVDSISLCSASSCSCSIDRETDRGSETETEMSCEECSRLEKNLPPCSCDELDTDAADNEDNDEEPEDQQQMTTTEDTDELESLLTGDELELNSVNLLTADHEPPFEKVHHRHLPPTPLLSCPNATSPSVSLKLSTERLKTSPIERPHSITPVNVSSFEAYIKCPPAENVSDCDRLTITIPGLHSSGRNRSFTRNVSNPYIWADFCEKLKSPKIESRKRANSCFPELNQNCYLNEAFSPSENLTPITPIKDIEGAEDRFDDNFWDYLNQCNNHKAAVDEYSDSDADAAVKAALFNLRKLQSSCSCECNSSVTSTTVYNITSVATCSEMSSCDESSDNNEGTSVSISISGSVPESSSATSIQTEFHEDQPLVSPCDCVCHRNGAHNSLAQYSFAELSTNTSLATNGQLLSSTTTTTNGMTPGECCSTSAGAALYDSTRNTEDDEISSQLSSSTLSSSTSSDSSTSQSVRLLDTYATTSNA